MREEQRNYAENLDSMAKNFTEAELKALRKHLPIADEMFGKIQSHVLEMAAFLFAAYARRLRPHHALVRHRAARAFIEAELSHPFGGPSVVVTHHAPIGDVVAADDPLTPAYACDLRATIEKFAPTIWVHGHIHSSADRMVGRTRVIANPKGYPPPDHNPDFDPLLVVEI